MEIPYPVLLRVWSVDQEIGNTSLGWLEVPSLRPHPKEADQLEAAF